MTRLLLCFAFVAATSVAAFADEPPTAGATTTPPKPKFKNVTPFQLNQAKISGSDPHLPDDVKVFYANAGQVSGMYKLCAGIDGNVAFAAAVQSIPGGDDAVLSTLRTWKFKPQPDGAICSVSRFVFTIGAGSPKEPLPPNAHAAAPTDVVKIGGEQPRLPDAVKLKLKGVHRVVGVYQICVGHDGRVESVKPIQSIAGGDEAIMTTLRTWTFQPPQKWKTVCSPSVFTFDIG